MRKLFAYLITSFSICSLFAMPCRANEATIIQPVTRQEKLTEKLTPSVATIKGMTCYLDLGSLSGQLWGFMEWWPVTQLNTVQYGQYLTSLFSQLKGAGVNQINLAFTQFSSIDALLVNGQGGSQYDVIVQMMIDFPGALQQLIQQAHGVGIKVDLSFGGENGTQMQICGTGETAQGQAQKLAQFMQTNSIDAVDFDIENTTFTAANSASDAQTFFQTLKNLLQAQGKDSILTIEGGIQDWPLNFLKELFYDANHNLIFPQLFTGLNLMLYSATQYYLDANNPTWGIEQWIDLLGTQNAGLISIGFEDAINYVSASASAGGKYNIHTSNSGVAAAQIYQQLLQQLQTDGYPTSFRQPFFWPDANLHATGTWSRYETLNQSGVISVNFDAGVMKYFYTTLK